ncbi:hypothetical protein ACJMK2_039784 [Sinanodonta woodiana]|uniref:EF-hand domain-containing protein n=1 Tax=Sinanodonta woodiana TaxID=1069815 RepID=A0ABD3WD69_SINWO
MQYLAAIIAFICWQGCLGLNLRPYNVTALSMFVNNDLNHDGYFTLDEVHLTFALCDSNHDGRVSRHEYMSYVDLHTPTLHDLSHALYDDYDVDHDNHLDEHDFQNFFNLMDTDKDHRVSALEWEQYWVNQFIKYEHLHLHGHGGR